MSCVRKRLCWLFCKQDSQGGQSFPGGEAQVEVRSWRLLCDLGTARAVQVTRLWCFVWGSFVGHCSLFIPSSQALFLNFCSFTSGVVLDNGCRVIAQLWRALP